jgi:hypothetical protein
MLAQQTAQSAQAADTSTLAALRRPAFLLAGPLAVVSIVMVVLAGSTSGGDAVKMVTGAAGIASNVLALAALIALAIGLAVLPSLVGTLRAGFGRIAWLVALLGTVLVSGGYWSSVFVQPGLADAAPNAIRDGIGSVTAGFIASYLVLGLGWVLLAIALLRARLVAVSGWFLLATALIAISPVPFRYLPLAVAATFACGLRLGRRTERA